MVFGGIVIVCKLWNFMVKILFNFNIFFLEYDVLFFLVFGFVVWEYIILFLWGFIDIELVGEEEEEESFLMVDWMLYGWESREEDEMV